LQMVRHTAFLAVFGEVDTNNPGYVVFNPAFQEREAEKIRKEQ
jgi:hypothetical protein